VGTSQRWPGLLLAKWAKHLDLLREVVPGLARTVTLVEPANPGGVLGWDEFRRAAESAGIQSERVDVRSADELEAAFEAPAFHAAQAFENGAPGLLAPVRARVAELALQHRSPDISIAPLDARAGLLMVYGVNQAALYRRAAVYVDKILKGAKPGDIPVEQPTVFDFLVNVKTLQILGLTVPPSMLPLVTEWIQ
jgi:putative ABC transport system substrate-binding protein